MVEIDRQAAPKMVAAGRYLAANRCRQQAAGASLRRWLTKRLG